VVDMYSTFDKVNYKSPLKERIAIIKAEKDAAKKKGKDAGVQKNDAFPETIPKRLSLLYQNKWKPTNPAL
jgi:hypothetical protein